MMKKPTVILAVILLLSLIGCGQDTQALLRQNSSSISMEDSVPELIGVTKEDVDFLSLEQWALVEKGSGYIQYFELSSGHFHNEEYLMAAPEKVINGLTYRKYMGEQYDSWDDFYNDMTSVFTPEYFTELNVKSYGSSGEADTYININGDLYYISADRGANPTYIRELDRYELIEANDQRIEFNLIAYYLSDFNVGMDGSTPENMSRCPIILENTQDGWRISKITLPY